MAESAARPIHRRTWFVQVMRWGGYAALVLAILFLGRAVLLLDLGGVVQRLGGAGWTISLVAVLAYAALLALLARAWSDTAAGRGGAPWRIVVGVYGPGVIAKYIPGSVFQYASRQLLGAGIGWSQGSMARASLAEAAIHIPCALVAATALFVSHGLLGIVLTVVIGAVMALFSRAALLQAGGWQLMFFSGFGAIAYILAAHALGIADPAPVAAMFMLAWIAGFLVPVAPGGIGIRESVLLVLCAPYEQAAAIAVFAILTRLVTTAGDAAFGLIAYSLPGGTRANRHASG